MAESIWLVLAKKSAGHIPLRINDAIDTALCFGWIDSLPNKVDEYHYKVRFSPRNPKSNWSKVNKDKITRLIAENRMHASGMAMVELAKKNGTWTALDEVEAGILPNDLREELNTYTHATEHFNGFPRSTRRGILEWIHSAKRPDTRLRRIRETARLAQENIRANQYRR